MITAAEASRISEHNADEETKLRKRLDKEMDDIETQIRKSTSIGSKKAFIKKLYHDQTKEKLKELGYTLSVCTPCFETVISWE